MQNYVIVLGGLELEFMRKLALYLREHLDSRIEVEICSESAYGTMPENRQAVWMGSEKFLQDIAARDPDSHRIVLGDEEREENTWLFRFQSREKLCRDIWKKCRTFGFQPMRGVRCGRKNRIALTSDSSVGKLLAFSMVCAQIFGKKSEGNIRYCAVCFQGYLKILNAETFWENYQKGIGAGKSYGLGLLLLSGR